MKGKDKEAFIQELLVAQYEKYYQMAYGYVQSENAALDIVSESAYKAIFYADKLKKQEEAENWIEGILIKEAAAYAKKVQKACTG